MNRLLAKLTSTAIPFRPDSCSERRFGTVVVLTSAAPGAPLAYTRMRPGRSVTNIVPSGAKARSHGMTSPLWTTVAVGIGAAARAGSRGPVATSSTATSSETTSRGATGGFSPCAGMGLRGHLTAPTLMGERIGGAPKGIRTPDLHLERVAS